MSYIIILIIQQNFQIYSWIFNFKYFSKIGLSVYKLWNIDSMIIQWAIYKLKKIFGSYNSTAKNHIIIHIWCVIYFGMREPRAFRSNDLAIMTDNPRRRPVQFHNSERRAGRENEGIVEVIVTSLPLSRARYNVQMTVLEIRGANDIC